MNPLTVSGTINRAPDGCFNQILVRNDEVELKINIDDIQRIKNRESFIYFAFMLNDYGFSIVCVQIKKFKV